MKFSHHLSTWQQRIVFCLAGFFLTLVYDIVTLFAYPLAVGLGDAGLIGILIKGLPFIIFHEFINSIIFLTFMFFTSFLIVVPNIAHGVIEIGHITKAVIDNTIIEIIN